MWGVAIDQVIFSFWLEKTSDQSIFTKSFRPSKGYIIKLELSIKFSLALETIAVYWKLFWTEGSVWVSGSFLRFREISRVFAYWWKQQIESLRRKSKILHIHQKPNNFLSLYSFCATFLKFSLWECCNFPA